MWPPPPPYVEIRAEIMEITVLACRPSILHFKIVIIFRWTVFVTIKKEINFLNLQVCIVVSKWLAQSFMRTWWVKKRHLLVIYAHFEIKHRMVNHAWQFGTKQHNVEAPNLLLMWGRRWVAPPPPLLGCAMTITRTRDQTSYSSVRRSCVVLWSL